MSDWIDAYVEKPDGSRGETVCKIGEDPLRDDAPRKQIEQEIIDFENWATGRHWPAA